MIILILFAFLAGIVTILSPCILPILPIILSSTADNSGKKRPLGVVVGFIASFTIFTLTLSSIVKLTGVPADALRYVSIVILIIFGLAIVIPKVQLFIETLFSKLASHVPSGQNHKGFFGGIIVGLSLGLLWTPCVGPILASVISLALSGSITTDAVFITLAYSLGTAIPMFIIMIVGGSVLQKVPWLTRNTANIQKIFGILMVITAIGIYFNYDRKFQTFILETFPQYGVGLTKFEDNELVKQSLEKVNQITTDDSIIGKPSSDMNVPKGPVAPEIIPGGKWFNSEPLKLADLKGKVVIIDFWTYSCINCIRTLPYLRQWNEKYKDKGLVIIGVHSPEFEFEKSESNVEKAIKDFNLTYPIVQDNDFATWRAYKNKYWPAKYFIDKEGRIRYTHFGEGAYDESEQMIQDLLKEAGISDLPIVSNDESPQNNSKTPELYIGHGRIDNFASPERIKKDIMSVYTIPSNLKKNQFAFGGNWQVMEEYSNPGQGAKLELNFDAREVYLVMRTKSGPSKVKVFIDGETKFFGDDNIDGVVTIDKDRLYKLIKLPNPGQHLLRLEFEDNNTEVFAFTFG